MIVYGGGFEIDKLRSKIDELSLMTMSDGFWNDSIKAQKISKELAYYESQLKDINHVVLSLQSLKELGKIIGTSTPALKKDVGVVGMFQGFSPKQLQKAERKELTEGE